MSDGMSRRRFLKGASLASAGAAAAGISCQRMPLGPGTEAPGSRVYTKMGAVREEARDLPIAESCDICVVGGSSTGVFAAVAAARLGAKVAIIEQNGFFGGVATASLVNVWHSTNDTTGRNPVIAGLTTEVIERLKQRDAVTERGSATVGCYLNTEELKIELDNLITEAKVRPFLHAVFAAPILRDGRLAAVAIEDKSGRRAIAARYFIDATGDGDLAARMGLSFESHGNIQPPTMCAILRGLGEIRERHPNFNINQAIFDERYGDALPRGFSWSAPVPGSRDDVMLAGTRVFGADCSDADQLTRAEMEGRRQIRAVCDLLRENFSPAGTVPLAVLPARIGIRDSRHIRCLHQLTEAEVLNGKRFPDAIANGTYRVDIHLADRGGIIFRYLNGVEEIHTADGRRTVGRWRNETPENPTFYQIPYRSLVPLGAANVLVAGRCIDADPGAFGAVRVMVNCNQMGQAAGTAAFLALASNTPVGAIDTNKLRGFLKHQGALVL